MKRISRAALWTATLAMLILGVGVVSAIIPFRQIMEQRARVEAATMELATLQSENRLLEEEIAALNTPQEVERLARERLGYVMPGEIPYVVVEPPADATINTVPESLLPVPPDDPWYRDIWEFLTGADLANG
ncbi:MAG TPA: septum formation initiator family protein [Acidimicrobiia bacterium]|nr:septum formation initiator family protein [Acidimicrobiia bacterium]